jgi:hypothetical protein
MAFTGEPPEKLTAADFWAFRTGGFDEKGRPERFLLPTYLKDVKSYFEDAPTTLTHKIHPIWSMVKQAAANKDYYGREIRSQDDNWAEQLGDLAKFGAKQFYPFWVQGAGRTLEREGGVGRLLEGDVLDVGKRAVKVIAPLAGVAPAPAAYAKSKAEKLLDEYTSRKSDRPIGKIAVERQELRAKLRRELVVHGNAAPLHKARAEGRITSEDVRTIIKSRKDDPLVYGIKHQSVNINDALRVYAKATPEEKKRIYPALSNKYRNALKNTAPVRRKELTEQYNNVVNR